MQKRSNNHFIGVGGQRCGTSWLYACLYEHPEVCAPIKEIHFFSRDRYSKGMDWYWNKFSGCRKEKITGEISTSYLCTQGTAEKIKKEIPNSKIIAVLRNPVDRAYSQYMNAVKTGKIDKDITFEEAMKTDSSYVEQGIYMRQIKEYVDVFDKKDILFLVYEDSRKDPRMYIDSIYSFLEIKVDFEPSMLYKEINQSRRPKMVFIDKLMITVANFLRNIKLDKLVWMVKKSGLPSKVRSVNTEVKKNEMNLDTKEKLKAYFTEDVKELGVYLQRDLHSLWNI